MTGDRMNTALTRRVKLTLKRLDAIKEALGAKLAGELEGSDNPREDYEAAQEWARDEIAKRKARAKP